MHELTNNKKHSENVDTSTSVTFDLELWPWPSVKVKKAYVIRCGLLYGTLVPGMMSVSVIDCDIWPLVHFLRPLTFACDLHGPPRSLSFLLLVIKLCCVIVLLWKRKLEANDGGETALKGGKPVSSAYIPEWTITTSKQPLWACSWYY